ncbi:hypothetical protein C8R44DRAFT_730280 [Mycena epipterygia]|nr:hypothetical protein C8R44DRAFT_730280 [Mycena epipterygia]
MSEIASPHLRKCTKRYLRILKPRTRCKDGKRKDSEVLPCGTGKDDPYPSWQKIHRRTADLPPPYPAHFHHYLPVKHIRSRNAAADQLAHPSRVSITCYLSAPSAFQKIWDRSSPSIRSLYLDCQHSPENFEPVGHHCVAPIKLEALRISCMEGLVADWLRHETCPFKFSNLKILSVGRNLDILRWKSFASALRKIEALELEVNSSTLRNSAASTKLIDIISTIPPSSNLREVVIFGVVEEESVCHKLDFREVIAHIHTIGRSDSVHTARLSLTDYDHHRNRKNGVFDLPFDGVLDLPFDGMLDLPYDGLLNLPLADHDYLTCDRALDVDGSLK